MAKQTIGIGSTANDGTGDPLRTAFDKTNDNFDELYANLLGDDSDHIYEIKSTVSDLIAIASPLNGKSYKTLGYHAVGDGGGNAYVYDSTSTATVDGGFVLNGPEGTGRYLAVNTTAVSVKQFGARGNATISNLTSGTDDSAAIQATFDAVATKSAPIPVLFPPGAYRVDTGIDLPKQIWGAAQRLHISGYGATLQTQNDVRIFNRDFSVQSPNGASTAISQETYTISGFNFRGPATGGTGIYVAALFTAEIRDCHFTNLDYGVIGTFCLGCNFVNLRATKCRVRPFWLRSGNGVWTGGALSNSASNVSAFYNCRVFGVAGATASYTIHASDAVVLQSCISEGGHDGIDVEFDYQGSTTTTMLIVREFHAEASNASVNFRLRCGGTVLLENIRRSYPAALFNTEGSSSANFIIRGQLYTANRPTESKFFQYGGVRSTGNCYRFESTGTNVQNVVEDNTNWTDDLLPYVYAVESFAGANGGTRYKTNSTYNIEAGTMFGLALAEGTPLTFFGGGAIGLRNSDYDISNVRPSAIAVGDGGVLTKSVTTLATALKDIVSRTLSVSGAVAANTTLDVTLSFSEAIAGDRILANPPAQLTAGIVYNAYCVISGEINLRLANLTGAEIVLSSSNWRITIINQASKT